MSMIFLTSTYANAARHHIRWYLARQQRSLCMPHAPFGLLQENAKYSTMAQHKCGFCGKVCAPAREHCSCIVLGRWETTHTSTYMCMRTLTHVFISEALLHSLVRCV